MEHSIKKKVNRIGLAGQIVSIILIILMAVASFGCLLGGTALAILPNDAVTIGTSVDMDVTVGKSLIGRWMDEITDEPSELNAQLSVNGTDFTDMQLEKTEDGLMIRAASDRVVFNLKRLVSAVFSGFVGRIHFSEALMRRIPSL